MSDMGVIEREVKPIGFCDFDRVMSSEEQVCNTIGVATAIISHFDEKLGEKFEKGNDFWNPKGLVIKIISLKELTQKLLADPLGQTIPFSKKIAGIVLTISSYFFTEDQLKNDKPFKALKVLKSYWDPVNLLDAFTEPSKELEAKFQARSLFGVTIDNATRFAQVSKGVNMTQELLDAFNFIEVVANVLQNRSLSGALKQFEPIKEHIELAVTVTNIALFIFTKEEEQKAPTTRQEQFGQWIEVPRNYLNFVALPLFILTLPVVKEKEVAKKLKKELDSRDGIRLLFNMYAILSFLNKIKHLAVDENGFTKDKLKDLLLYSPRGATNFLALKNMNGQKQKEGQSSFEKFMYSVVSQFNSILYLVDYLIGKIKGKDKPFEINVFYGLLQIIHRILFSRYEEKLKNDPLLINLINQGIFLLPLFFLMKKEFEKELIKSEPKKETIEKSVFTTQEEGETGAASQ